MSNYKTNKSTTKEIENVKDIRSFKLSINDCGTNIEYYAKDGVIYLELASVAYWLGFFDRVRKNKWVYNKGRIEEYLTELGQPIEYASMDYIPENIYYLLTTKADGAATYEFQQKMTEELLSYVHKQYGIDTNGAVDMNNQVENKLDIIDTTENESDFDNTDLAVLDEVGEFQVFENSEFGKLRIIDKEGEVWFVGKDVAEMLGYKDTAKAIQRHVDEEDKGVDVLSTPGGKQSIIIINESGLYSLVLSSKLPTAKQFKRWVTSEILPSIRKTGGYVVKGKEKEFLHNPNSPIHSEVENLIKVISVLQKEVMSLSANVKALKLPNKQGANELNERKVNIWKKQVSTPIINSISEKLNISFEEALNLVYDRMKMDYGFSKGYAMSEFCDRYGLSYGMNNVSIITAIADNSVYQKYFVKAANTIINSIMYVRLSDNCDDGYTENSVELENSIKQAEPKSKLKPDTDCIDEDMKKIIKFQTTDDPDEIIRVLTNLKGCQDKKPTLLYRTIYSRMATDRAWKVSLTRNRCKTKKQLILKNDSYKKRFVQACNEYLQEG